MAAEPKKLGTGTLPSPYILLQLKMNQESRIYEAITAVDDLGNAWQMVAPQSAPPRAIAPLSLREPKPETDLYSNLFLYFDSVTGGHQGIFSIEKELGKDFTALTIFTRMECSSWGQDYDNICVHRFIFPPSFIETIRRPGAEPGKIGMSRRFSGLKSELGLDSIRRQLPFTTGGECDVVFVATEEAREGTVDAHTTVELDARNLSKKGPLFLSCRGPSGSVRFQLSCLSEARKPLLDSMLPRK